jgi:hypothetical protein
VLSNGAVKRVDDSMLKELVVTNSIDPTARTQYKKLQVREFPWRRTDGRRHLADRQRAERQLVV